MYYFSFYFSFICFHLAHRTENLPLKRTERKEIDTKLKKLVTLPQRDFSVVTG